MPALCLPVCVPTDSAAVDSAYRRLAAAIARETARLSLGDALELSDRLAAALAESGCEDA